MVYTHTYSESDNALLRYGRLKFSKMAAGRHLEFDPTGKCWKYRMYSRWSTFSGTAWAWYSDEERRSRFTNRLFCDGGLQDLFLAVWLS